MNNAKGLSSRSEIEDRFYRKSVCREVEYYPWNLIEISSYATAFHKKMRPVLWCLLLIVITITLSCKKEDDSTKIPKLKTLDVTNIGQTEASSGGELIARGETALVSWGVCWSIYDEPTIDDSITDEELTAQGTFISILENLSPNTHYYVRAYAKNSNGTGYGNTLSFVTLEDETTYADCGTVTDVDGNTYNTVQIGDQCWMKENLKVSTYRNGEAITTNLSNSQWENSTTGVYSIYNGLTQNDEIYGKLYNWSAVADSRGLCPTGWHVPTATEWNELIEYLGGQGIAGGKMKEKGTAHWAEPNTGATNQSGFTGLPGGLRGSSGEYFLLGERGGWWTSTEYDAYNAYIWDLSFDSAEIFRGLGKRVGFSCRCLKD